MTLKPARTLWRDVPPVVIHRPEIAVKRHPDYRAAKSGDVQAAFSLVRTTIAESAVVKIRDLVSGRQVILALAHAVERDGVNAIPEALADELGARLNLPVDEGLVQIFLSLAGWARHPRRDAGQCAAHPALAPTLELGRPWETGGVVCWA